MKEIKKVIIEAVQDSIDLTDNQVSISVLNILLDQQLPEQLALYGVSQQRELLVWLKNKDLVTFTKDEIEEVIDDYKLNQTNCG